MKAQDINLEMTDDSIFSVHIFDCVVSNNLSPTRINIVSTQLRLCHMWHLMNSVVDVTTDYDARNPSILSINEVIPCIGNPNCLPLSKSGYDIDHRSVELESP